MIASLLGCPFVHLASPELCGPLRAQALFTAHSGTFTMGTLVLYGVMFWFLSAVTYGAFIPSGLFTPSLIFGGCMG